MTAPSIARPPVASQLTSLTARELAARIASGELTAREVVDAHIARIEEVNAALNAVVWTRFDAARTEAKEVDARRLAGQSLGPLAGVPITIKESLDFAGAPSTFGIEGREQVLAAADDVYVKRLRDAGAVVLGKTNVAQLLLFMETDNPVYGQTNHPADAERSPGGSSGGQAAIIAAGGSPLGLGTDIGGSCRIPAAFCGVVGFKPTAGLMPDPGQFSVPLGQRAIVSQVGVLGRTVDDVMLGFAVASNATAPKPAPDMKGLRVGFFTDDGLFAPSAAYVRAVKETAVRLRAQGADVVPFARPDMTEPFELFYRLLAADSFKGMARALGKSRRDPRVKQLEMASRLPRPVFAVVKQLLALSGRRKAQRVLNCLGPTDVDGYWRLCEAQLRIQTEWANAMGEARLDAVMLPAVALPALRHHASEEVGLMGAYTCLFNLLGWPAGVVPVTTVQAGEEQGTGRDADVSDQTAAETERGSAGLPIAVQFAAPLNHDAVVLAAMRASEPG